MAHGAAFHARPGERVLGAAAHPLSRRHQRDGDQESAAYERLSFGPGQRYASKGCYIVQLGRGGSTELVQKSDWVIQ